MTQAYNFVCFIQNRWKSNAMVMMWIKDEKREQKRRNYLNFIMNEFLCSVFYVESIRWILIICTLCFSTIRLDLCVTFFFQRSIYTIVTTSEIQFFFFFFFFSFCFSRSKLYDIRFECVMNESFTSSAPNKTFLVRWMAVVASGIHWAIVFIQNIIHNTEWRSCGKW